MPPAPKPKLDVGHERVACAEVFDTISSSLLVIIMLRIYTIVLLWLALTGFGWAQSPVRGTLIPVDTPAASATQVKVGFYPVSVYELEMGSNTFYADLYVWLRWTGDIDPVASLEFTNMVEEWGKQLEALQEEPKILEDGSKYVIFKVEGRFVQPFNLSSYPLDKQRLSIRIEDSLNTADAITYVIDKEYSGLGSQLQIPGWSLTGWSGQVFHHDYGSSFGEDGASPMYSVAEFSLHIERPDSYFFWKLLMPLFIVLLAALSALILSPRSIDARTALPGGALLTAIFLQMGYSDGLPELAYLILMDKIYLVAYGMIVLTLVRAIVTFQRCDQADAVAIQRMLRTDKWLMVIQLLSFMAATAFLVRLH
jgi:hypothetical protein